MFYRHECEALKRAFATKPYQGAAPETAKYLFVGLDANYSETIDKSAIFDRVLEYLDDGVAFWTENGVHHPFLLHDYKGSGKLDGRGIPPDVLPHLFDPFRRPKRARSRRGLGLGLAIVRHVVELHGGSVDAASDGEGRGAAFTVRLPAHSAG